MKVFYSLDSRLRGNDNNARACAMRWNKQPIWIHGDFAIGNILMDSGKLSAIIDFGGVAIGDPACDLVIVWTYLIGKAREIFISKMDIDPDTLLSCTCLGILEGNI